MRSILKITGLVLITNLLVWLPFKMAITDMPGWHFNFDEGMKKIWANFDGPNYLTIARSWYDKEVVRRNFSSPIPLEYYPAHLPFYPATIWVLDRIFSGPWAMLISTSMGSVLAGLAFLEMLKREKITNEWWLVTIFMLLPARWLAVRTVGSPEPWFIFFILMSLIQYKNGKYLWAGVWGALAQWTKSPAILLFLGYFLFVLFDWVKLKKINWRAWPVLFIPLSAVVLFWFYGWRTGDVWAYLHSGDNFHLFFPPFSIFAPKGQVWVGDFWLEDVIWIWLVYGVGVTQLWKSNLKLEATFAGVFWLSTLFVSHRDLSRYILPIWPLMVLAFANQLAKKEIKVILGILVVPVFLFVWNFLLHNGAPIADWAPYL